MGSIRLFQMRFHAIIGDLPHEREQPQPLEVDLEVETPFASVAGVDTLDAGVDYRELYDVVARSMSTDPKLAPRLLETLCVRIAESVASLPGTERVVVRCRKPWAALAGPVERVEVEVERP